MNFNLEKKKPEIKRKKINSCKEQKSFVADLSLVDALVCRNPPITEGRQLRMRQSVLSGPPLFVGSTNEKPRMVGWLPAIRAKEGSRRTAGRRVGPLYPDWCHHVRGSRTQFVDTKMGFVR